MNYKIVGTTVTELCQSEGSNTVNGVPTLSIMKKECIEDGKIGRYPYYSGNSFRGIMHREIANYVMKRIGERLSPADYHLNYAGGGSNYQTQTLDVVAKIRELNPIVSVFGTSLAVEGKLMISNLEPVNKFWRENQETGARYSGLRDSLMYIKKDDILDGGALDKYSAIVSDDDKDDYISRNSDVQEARAIAREKVKNTGSETEKIQKESVKSYNKAECIIIGATLVSYVGKKSDFTQIEKGMLLKGLELMMSQQLGGIKNKGYGVMSYSVVTEDAGSAREVMSSSKNELDIYKPIISLQLSSEERECVAAFEQWIDTATIANMKVSDYLK